MKTSFISRNGAALGIVLIGLVACLHESACHPIQAAEPLTRELVTLDNVVDPGPNRADEPMAAEFSLTKARHFLDSAALSWQKERKCFTCHTNFAYLYVPPVIINSSEAGQEGAQATVRSFAEELIGRRWSEEGPRWDAEVVATAAALAFHDAAVTGKLHPRTREALDRMWTVQQEDGGWNWLKCEWPPMESDDHYGVTLAAIAVGVAPEGYANTPAAKKGLAGIRRYFQSHAPPTLHHRAMLLWASRYLPDLQSMEEKAETIAQLRACQQPDGGWGLATLGNWNRGDGQEQDLLTSDGYGTGFVLFVLRQANVSKADEQIQQGIQWLKSNQRESGRWFTRSLYKDNKHFISHAGTAMAVMALVACE